jgi:NTP pyrophosphatase (non-canonical NTP hydrolase)
VAEAIRRSQGDKEHKNARMHLEEEMGDLLISICTVAVGQGIDLESAAKKAKAKIIQRHGG